MNDNFLKVAKQAALEAGKIILKYYGKSHKKDIKYEDNSDFTTQADIESEKKIVNILTKNFPTHNIIAEENSRINNNSEYTWVIDPLDGTFTYSIGLPYFCISIGLLKNNSPIVGIIYQPALKKLYFAQQGKGAYLDDKKLKVSLKESLDKAAVFLDPGHRKKRNEKINKYILPLLTKVGQPYDFGSGCAAQVLVAEGILEAIITNTWIWDVLASAVLVSEAGGVVSNFSGKDIDWSKDRVEILASNGLLHDQILEALK